MVAHFTEKIPEDFEMSIIKYFIFIVMMKFMPTHIQRKKYQFEIRPTLLRVETMQK